MSAQPSLFSTYDVSRGRRNASSKAANPSDQSKANRQAVILDYIKGRTMKGTTMLDIENWFGWEKHTFSGRITELKKLDKIVATGRRDGHTVYSAKVAQ